MASAETPDGRSALADPVFDIHRGGKLRISGTVPVHNADDLSLIYTPGVARVCTAIAEEPDLVHDYTWASGVVAVITDGSAVLGLGNIGPAASLPVMEGKAVLFKRFAEVDAVPIALACTDVDDIVETIVRLAPSFGGINLEDISAPRCFDIEQALIERLDIPVFHDDQHGTAIVTLAALSNAARLTGRSLGELRAVVYGAGAAGTAIAEMLLDAGIGDVALVDRAGVLHPSRPHMSPRKTRMALRTNQKGITGSVQDALEGADVFIGVSGATVTEEAIASMADNSIVFALSNPAPEIDPHFARRHAAIVATGRSDYPNQINNVLVFPGLFAGALRVRARRISSRMKLAAAEALAGALTGELSPINIIPSPFDNRVVDSIATAVADAAHDECIKSD
jgi:malate dehydrogenase (oxaloacetate-decarboxylating)